MSISKFQEKFLSQKGCATVIALAMCVIMSFFLFSSCGRFGGEPEETAQTGSSIAIVGTTPVTAEQVTTALNQLISPPNSMGAPPPVQTYASVAQAAPYALSQTLSRAAFQLLAEQNHISLTDDSIMKGAKEIFDEMQPPSAKPDPKRDAQMKAVMDNLKTMLADPVKKQRVLDELIPQLVRDSMVASYPLTTAQIKKTFDNYEIKQIFIAGGSGGDPKAKADEALKAIKGGMSFEDAMNKYSKNPPEKGKKISDSKLDLPESEIAAFPNTKSLDGQAAGFVSEAIPDRGGFSIYKIVSVTNKAPKDLETNPGKYKKQVAQTAVSTKIDGQIKAILDSSSVKWVSTGYKSLYDFAKAQQTPDPKGPMAAMQKVADEAKAAAQGNGDKTPALYAWFDAESMLYNAPGADKTKLTSDRIDLLNAVLQNAEDYTLRLELTDLYIQKKDGTGALQQLVEASKANTTYDVAGQERFRDIAGKGSQLLALKLVTPQQITALNTEQEAWKKSKSDDDKMQAQMKADEAKQKIEDAANQKKNDELVKQQKAESSAKPGAETPGSTGSTTAAPKIQVTPTPPSAASH